MVTNPEDMSILSSILGVTQETINNRRLLQEVYDKRLLHKLLRVPLQATVITADVPIDQDAKVKTGVGAAWDGDMEPESDDDTGHEAVEEGNSEEIGRYDIQEQRPGRSERTNGTDRFDPLTTYTTDEEDLSGDSEDDDVRVQKERRRSYWLSKGIGPHEGDSED
ncbi:hypothetical protein JVT61DRAFT_12475 [Boletus reticuloceps]|uniref:Uncharacterized protein n=1 Tax=Boletus reticuloceps TaxID=495285 RepID=A0A8I2YDN2_9AGAM|nr:hypothetical protein JVT61DRAFT_12475 [Boletus reticuloceps]